ncbi:MAG: division/cell wall cluster transcriptional repressor MraZ [Candidatus Hermodarchaeia archaeon]|jgi:MraZ protein
MFFGEYTYKVDEKGRVPLPPRFRRQMKEGVILTKGMGETYIAVYPIAEWKRLSDRLAAKVVTPANLRRLNRAIHGSAFVASLDGQGRIILPFSLREYAGIGDEAIVIGANNCVELWCEGEWQAEQKAAEEQASEIIENFGE